VDILFVAVVLASVLLFFVGLAIVVANVADATFGRAGVARGLSSIDAIYATAAPGEPGDRAAGAVGVSSRVSQLGKAATPGRAVAYLRRRLDYAGNPPYWTADRVFELKGLSLVVFALVGAGLGFVAGDLFGAVIGGLLIGAPLGFFVPDIILYDVSERRQQKIRSTLPDILDTLTVSVEAGLGFDAALAQITRYGRGPLAGEFARVLQEMQIGRARVDTLRALGLRSNVTELKSFCAIVVQASELGIPIANVLREQSKEMRIRRRQHAEELAQKVPVKILFPLIFCLFPAIFIVVLGPGVINILNAFGSP
jgi:tight adherence protein C